MSEEEKYREQARDTWSLGSDDELEIDDDAVVSVSAHGAWVAAWVYVPLLEDE